MQATASFNLKAQTVPAMTNTAVEAASFSQDANEDSLSMKEYGNCIQGFVAGLFLEGVLALCLYGVYHIGQIGHVIR
jgi:hypothetical protein